MIRKVLVADDHPICVEAIRVAIQRIDDMIEVVPADSIAQVESYLQRDHYTALVLDLALKDSEGLANLSTALTISPQLPVLVVSANGAPDIVEHTAALGARGFLNKSAPLDEMRSAISVVLEGGSYFPQLRGKAHAGVLPVERLSRAQSRVMIELTKGVSNKVIAHELGLSEATVKSHLSAIYKVLGVSNRAQAILVLKEGALQPVDA